MLEVRSWSDISDDELGWTIYGNVYVKQQDSYSPAYSTGLTVILLLVFIKQVTNITVIFPKGHITLHASLLCLKEKWNKQIMGPYWYIEWTVRMGLSERQQFPFKITCCTVVQTEHCTSLTRKRSIWWSSSASWHRRQTYALPQHGAWGT